MGRKDVAVIKRIIIFLFVFFGLSLQTALAQPGFLKIAMVQGESSDKDHKGWIDVVSFNLSVSASGAKGQAGIGDLSVVKRFDKTSPALQKSST